MNEKEMINKIFKGDHYISIGFSQDPDKDEWVIWWHDKKTDEIVDERIYDNLTEFCEAFELLRSNKVLV